MVSKKNDTTPIPPPKYTSSSKDSKKPSPQAVKYYLVAYNVISALGWGYVLLFTLIHLFNLDGRSSQSFDTPKTASSAFSRVFSSIPFLKSSSYISSTRRAEQYIPGILLPLYRRAGSVFVRVGLVTAIVQTCAVLEIAHSFLGWVRSSLQTTLMQVYSRLFIVWAITEQFPETRTNPLYASMVFAWSTTEIIRYTFYALNLLEKENYYVTYLRYTTFWVLYPVGASSEAFLIYATLPKTSPIPSYTTWAQGGIWKPTDYIRGINFLIWWPSLYVLYTHMIYQRKKVLGPGAGHKLGRGKTAKVQ